jgi:hypothetical protein
MRRKGRRRITPVALTPEPPTIPVVTHQVNRDGLIALLSAWYPDVDYQSFDPLSEEETWEAVHHQIREAGPPDWCWAERANLDEAAAEVITRWAAEQIDRAYPNLRPSK